MKNQLSLLSRFTPDKLHLDPYPHIIIEDALNKTIADELLNQFPNSSVVNSDESMDNSRWSFSACDAQRDLRVSDIWKKMIDYHTSKEFWDAIRDAFGPNLESHIRTSRNQAALLDDSRVGIRGDHNFDSSDILLEAQISGNTPVTKPTAVRGTHLDEGNKIFSGLYYLRSHKDDSVGGDFQILRWKKWVPSRLKAQMYFEGMMDCVELVKRVPYRHNTLVLLLDSIDALHSVSVRSPTNYSRLFLNLDGVLPDYEYRLGAPNLVARVRRKLPRGTHVNS